MLITDMGLAPFVATHLQVLHPRDGHGIGQLTPYTLNQGTIPITEPKIKYWYFYYLNNVGFGLYCSWQESWLHTCIPIH